MRALFLGHCGPLPARVIWAWIEAGHTVSEIWTSSRTSRATWRKDRHLGWFAPKLSVSAAIERFKPPHRVVNGLADPAVVERLVTADVDVVVGVFFLLILPRDLLARIRVPVLNLHPTLLPAYRGPTPLAAMLHEEATERCGGVTLHRMAPKIDAGPIVASARVPLPPDRNPRRWEIHLARAAANLAVSAIPDVVAGTAVEILQNEAFSSYRRTNRSIFVVDQTVTAARLDYLLATLGWFGPVEFTANGTHYAVTRIVHRLGSASGEPARIGRSSVDVDLADGRYRLRRRPVWEGRKIRWATFFLRVRERE